jgi:hypothetical protein
MILKFSLLTNRQKTDIENIQTTLNEKLPSIYPKITYSDHTAKPSRGVVENCFPLWKVS